MTTKQHTVCIHETEIVLMKDHLESIKKSVDKMTKVLLEGNGHPPLTQTVYENSKQTKYIPEILTRLNQAEGVSNGKDSNFKKMVVIVGVILALLQIAQIVM